MTTGSLPCIQSRKRRACRTWATPASRNSPRATRNAMLAKAPSCKSGPRWSASHSITLTFFTQGCGFLQRDKVRGPPRTTGLPAEGQPYSPQGCHPQKRLRHPKVGGHPLRQNQILPRFRGRDMKQFLNFTLPPYRGGSPRRRISLALLQPTPDDSTRAATRWCERISGRF